MDCVYTAFAGYCEWLGYHPTMVDYRAYRRLKVIALGLRTQMTFGGVVPWMLTSLGKRYGYTGLIAEYRLFTPQMYAKIAPNIVAWAIIKQSNFGLQVEQITLSPAIYLNLSAQHALFAEAIPTKGSIIAAYQFRKES